MQLPFPLRFSQSDHSFTRKMYAYSQGSSVKIIGLWVAPQPRDQYFTEAAHIKLLISSSTFLACHCLPFLSSTKLFLQSADLFCLPCPSDLTFNQNQWTYI